MYDDIHVLTFYAQEATAFKYLSIRIKTIAQDIKQELANI